MEQLQIFVQHPSYLEVVCAHRSGVALLWAVSLSDGSNSEQLIQVLQNTLVELETTSGVSSDNPDLLALKSIILNRVAQLELAKADGNTSPEHSKVSRTEDVSETGQRDPGIAAKSAA